MFTNNHSLYIEFIFNISLILSMMSLYILSKHMIRVNKYLMSILLGVIFGAVAVGGMMFPVNYAQGIIYDGRHVVLAIAGLFGGALTVSIAAFIALIYRFAMGGGGIWAGMTTIVVSSLLGILLRNKCYMHPERLGPLRLYIFGIVISVFMLLCQLLIQPWPLGVDIIGNIWISVMSIFPIGTLLIGLMMGTANKYFNEQKLLKQAKLFTENLIQTANIMFVQLDIKGRVQRINKSAERITGYSEYEILGKNWFETLVPKNVYPDVWDLFMRIKGGKERISHFENPIIDKSGNEHYISWQNSALEENNRLLGTISFGIDITEKKANENKLKEFSAELEYKVAKRTAQLKEANKSLETFAYSVSHDLRSPLRAISGFSEIISQRYKSQLSAEAAHYFDNIVEASKRMNILITDLLTYSRLTKETFIAAEINTGMLIKKVISEIKNNYNIKDIIINISDGIPNVFGVETMLWQVFSNIIDNAFKYRKKDEKLIIEIYSQNKGKHTRIFIKDNGIGIDAKYHDKIFNIFQRLHSIDDYSGTGIGLAIVKKSMEMMRGEVGIISDEDNGSTFWVQIPSIKKQGD